MSLKTEWEQRRDAKYRGQAAGRPRCKSDGFLLDETGRCWFCQAVDPKARRAFRAVGGIALKKGWAR